MIADEALRVGLLFYIVGDDATSACVVDRNGGSHQFHLAFSKEIFPLIDTLLAAMQGDYSKRHTDGLFYAFSEEWGPKLLPPLSALEAFDVLLVVPQHSLHSLPLHAIRVSSTHYLGTRFGLTYCSSLSLLRHCMARNRWRRDPASGAPRRCAAVATDIQFGKTAQYESVARKFADHFPEHEILDPYRLSLVARTDAMPLRDEQFWDCVCIVCHGHEDLQDPDESGLLLERAPVGMSREMLIGGRQYAFRCPPFRYVPSVVSAREDVVPEILTVAELRTRYRTNAQLVALLGCTTAAGTLLSNDDFTSPAYQWLKAGAVSVLASQWDLDVTYLEPWCERFLKAWIDGKAPKAIAWRDSLINMLSTYPDFGIAQWAAPALFGDWK